MTKGGDLSAVEFPKPTVLELFFAFAKLSLSSFGGGVSGWVRIEFVNRKRWISIDEFLLGFSLAQALPGVNILNLAIWIGFELHGTLGVLAALGGVLLPTMLTAIIIFQTIARVSDYQLTHLLLAGVAVAGFSMSISSGLIAIQRRVRDWSSVIVFAAAFSSIFIFHFPILIVLAVLAPASVGTAYWKIKRHA